MKIYVGTNKKNAKEMSLKDIICISMEMNLHLSKKVKVTPDRFNDDSSSWINIRTNTRDGKSALDIVLEFDPENENKIVDIDVFKSDYILDEENMKRLV